MSYDTDSKVEKTWQFLCTDMVQTWSHIQCGYNHSLTVHSWQNQHVLQWLSQLSEEVYSKSRSKFQQHAITGKQHYH